MKYKNVQSFKAKIRNIAIEKGIPSHQVLQIFLIEQVLRLIAQSEYRECFIAKGGYLISNIIGIDKRTTMDLDVTLQNMKLSEAKLKNVFDSIFNDKDIDGFYFQVTSIKPIRQADIYGGFQIKISAKLESLREVVYIDVTSGDIITPGEIEYRFKSCFSEDIINILSYNMETILSEKLEAVLSRGVGSTRPRDRYDLYTLWKLRYDEINIDVLGRALTNTANQRGTLLEVSNWRATLIELNESDYQRILWSNYQKSFKYAGDISFEDSCAIIYRIMDSIDFKLGNSIT